MDSTVSIYKLKLKMQKVIILQLCNQVIPYALSNGDKLLKKLKRLILLKT